MDKKQLPDIRFGDEPDEYEDLPDLEGDAGDEDDDELLDTTPPDVTDMLGFDPLEDDDSVS